MGKTDLELMVGANERIMWRGKPDLKCFILESIFNPLLPFALVWAFIDIVVVGGSMFAADGDGKIELFAIGFLAFHMMPVWMYLGGIIFSFLKYKNTEYIVTDRGVYISGGTFAYTNEMKPFTDLSHINIHRGIIDQMLGVGDVVMNCNHFSPSTNTSNSHGGHAHAGMTIADVKEYQRVFAIVKELQTDIYADTMFPNDLRPKENHGYQTTYTKNDQF